MSRAGPLTGRAKLLVGKATQKEIGEETLLNQYLHRALQHRERTFSGGGKEKDQGRGQTTLLCAGYGRVIGWTCGDKILLQAYWRMM